MRGWVSAGLDGELSEFESVLLRAHLLRCHSCSTFKADAANLATTLRHAPLEPLSRPIALPHRRRIAFAPLRATAAAALALSMIGVGGLFASLGSGTILNKPNSYAAAALDDQGLLQLQRQKPQAALAVLRARRQAFSAATEIPRTTGFQNP
jgi:predicted anti-sigma-YlaC factor YlaD